MTEIPEHLRRRAAQARVSTRLGNQIEKERTAHLPRTEVVVPDGIHPDEAQAVVDMYAKGDLVRKTDAASDVDVPEGMSVQDASRVLVQFAAGRMVEVPEELSATTAAEVLHAFVEVDPRQL